MIATEHQYKVTKDRLDKFSSTYRLLKNRGGDDLLARGHLAAVEAQIGRLQSELDEYEELRRGLVKEIKAETLADLPIVLIKARVARQFSQSALAQLIGVKPQQLQRWEQERYRTVSLQRLVQIANALKVKITERVQFDPQAPVPLADVRRSLRKLGFPAQVIEQRLMPLRVPQDEAITLFDELDTRIQMVVGAGARAVAAGQADLGVSQMRFKLPASAEQSRTRAYAHYAEALCRLVSKTSTSASTSFPESWSETRKLLFGNRGMSLRTALEACWDRGIGVLALRDPIAFHGACWRDANQTVIVLKQTSSQESRWLLDLIHEIYHDALLGAERKFMRVAAAETSAERRNSVEELHAQRFAAEVVTNGQAEQLTRRIAEMAGSEGPRLKRATYVVANESGIPVGILANLMAWRLAESGFSWWSVATGMQPDNEEPWKVIREVLFRRADLTALARHERDFLIQALETPDE